jgi:hypothetical protein
MIRLDTELNLSDDDEVMRRIRSAREKINKRYKTFDEYWAWVMSLEKQADMRQGARSVQTKAKKGRLPSATASRKTAARS